MAADLSDAQRKRLLDLIFFKRILPILVAVSLTAPLAGQQPKPKTNGKSKTVDLATAKPGRDPNQPIDEEYTKKIKGVHDRNVLPVAPGRLHAGVEDGADAEAILGDPIWRGETIASYFMVCNTILNFDSLDAGRKLDPR